MKMVTFGPLDGGPGACAEAVSLAASAVGGAGLVLLYLPLEAEHPDFLRAIGAEVSAPVVGVTTGGAAFTERGATRTGVVGAVIGGSGASVRTSLATGVRASGVASLKRALDRLRPFEESTSVLVLADAFACDGEEIVGALRAFTPAHSCYFGGTAGDDWRFQKTFVFAEGRVESDAVLFVALDSDQDVRLDVLHGWSPAPSARERIITEVAGNVVRSLDYRPAQEVYAEELERLGFLSPGAELTPQVMAKYELGVATPFRERLKIRAPLQVGDDGAIVLASSLNEGDVVRVVTTSDDRIIDSARQLSDAVVGGGANAALVFDCAARLQLLGDRYEQQVDAFVGDGAVPVLGVACYGELARSAGNVEGFHNTTAVMVGF